MNPGDVMRSVSWLRRYPFCVLCTVLSMALAVASWFLWQEMQSREIERTARALAGENMLTTLVSGTILRPELAYVRGFTQRIESNLVVADNLFENKGYFYSIETLAGVSLSDVQQTPLPAPDTDAIYRRIPFSLRLSGSFQQLAVFLRAIETGPRLSNITSFSFRRNAPPSQLITLELNVELLGKL